MLSHSPGKLLFSFPVQSSTAPPSTSPSLPLSGSPGPMTLRGGQRGTEPDTRRALQTMFSPLTLFEMDSKGMVETSLLPLVSSGY